MSIVKNKYLYVLMDPRKDKYYVSGLGITFEHEPFYVGMGKNKRWLVHNKEAINNNLICHNKAKRGIIKNILKSGLIPIVWIKGKMSKEACLIDESVFIEIIGRRDLNKGPLLNLTDGGECFSGYLIDEERRKKMSDIVRGEKNPFYNKKHTEETKDFLSKIRIGKKLPRETVEKIMSSRKGYKHSEETKRKIRLSNIGKHRNRTVSEETRKKLSIASRGRKCKNKGIKMERDIRKALGHLWEIITPDGIVSNIKNLNLFCQDHNLTHSAMSALSKGKGNHHKGYRCRKVNI